MDGGLVIFCCSALTYYSIYQLMKAFVVRMVFEPILRRQAGQRLKFSDGEVAHMAFMYIVIIDSDARKRRSYASAPYCTQDHGRSECNRGQLLQSGSGVAVLLRLYIWQVNNTENVLQTATVPHKGGPLVHNFQVAFPHPVHSLVGPILFL